MCASICLLSAINQAFDLDILDLLFVSSKAQVPYVRLRTRDNKTSMNYMRVLQLSYRRPFLETLKQINEKDTSPASYKVRLSYGISTTYSLTKPGDKRFFLTRFPPESLHCEQTHTVNFFVLGVLIT